MVLRLFVLPLLIAFLIRIDSLSSSTSAAYVNIVGLFGGQSTQSLPTSYVDTFDRWILNEDGMIIRTVNAASATNLRIQWTNTLKVRPCLNILIKNGVPAYVMAGLQIASREELDGRFTQYELVALPLAWQWTTFQFAVQPGFRIAVFGKDIGSEEDEEKEGIIEWEFGNNPEQQLQDMLQRFGTATSKLEEDSVLMTGYHILSVFACSSAPGCGGGGSGDCHNDASSLWTNLPKPRKGSLDYKVTALATAEPDAKELLGMEQTLLEMTASSLMELKVISRSKKQEEL